MVYYFLTSTVDIQMKDINCKSSTDIALSKEQTVTPSKVWK